MAAFANDPRKVGAACLIAHAFAGVCFLLGRRADR